jgi:stage V sporulation protein B
MKEPLKNAIIALIIHSIVIVLLLFFTKWNLFAILISTIVYALSMCILNQYSIRKYLGYKQEIKNTFLGPGFASLIMGAFAYASYTLLYMVTKINSISVIVAIFVASIIYFIIIMKLGVVSEEELNRLPKGRFMVRVARKTRLLK